MTASPINPRRRPFRLAAAGLAGLCAVCGAASLSGSAAAQGQVGRPIPLIRPLVEAPAPSAQPAAPPAAAPAGPQNPPQNPPPTVLPAPAGTAAPAATPRPGQSRAAAPAGIGVTELGTLDPSSIGLLDAADGGLGADMWQGARRSFVEALLPRIPIGAGSPATRELARRVLASAARVPEGEAKAPSLLGLRVERLAAAGDWTAAAELVGLAPPRLADKALARVRVDALLLADDVSAACAALAALLAADPADVYWLKGTAFCRAQGRSHAEAAFVAGLVRETGDSDAAFFTLVRAMAGEPVGALDGLNRLTAVHLAMVRAARVALPANTLDVAPPGLYAALARLSHLDLDLRLAAAERAVALGALSGEGLRQLYRAATFTPQDLGDPVTAIATLPGPRAAALLYQTVQAQQVAAARAEALTLALREARRRGTLIVAGRVLHESLRELVPSDEVLWFAIEAVPVLYLVGDLDTAARWFAFVQRNATPANRDALVAVMKLWPYAYLRDRRFADGWNGSAVLTPWWNGLLEFGASEVERLERGRFLLPQLAAVGLRVPDDNWQPVFAGPLDKSATVPAAPLLVRLREAAARGEDGLVALLALLALGTGGPAALEPAALAELVGALRAIGQEEVARGLALEAAVARLPPL